MKPDRYRQIHDLHKRMMAEFMDETQAPPEEVFMRAIGELLDEVDRLHAQVADLQHAATPKPQPEVKLPAFRCVRCGEPGYFYGSFSAWNFERQARQFAEKHASCVVPGSTVLSSLGGDQ